MTTDSVSTSPARVAAWHPASGNTLTGDLITRRIDREGWVTMVPDGLLEQVTLRLPQWVIIIGDA